jgi:hypothetical protein
MNNMPKMIFMISRIYRRCPTLKLVGGVGGDGVVNPTIEIGELVPVP